MYNNLSLAPAGFGLMSLSLYSEYINNLGANTQKPSLAYFCSSICSIAFLNPIAWEYGLQQCL